MGRLPCVFERVCVTGGGTGKIHSPGCELLQLSVCPTSPFLWSWAPFDGHEIPLKVPEAPGAWRGAHLGTIHTFAGGAESGDGRGDSQPACGKCPAGEQTTPGQRGVGQPRERM